MFDKEKAFKLSSRISLWIPYFALAYLIYSSLDLWEALRHPPPYLHYGTLAFIIWLLPFLTFWFLPKLKSEVSTFSPLLVVAVILAFLGQVGSIHALSHLGLAIGIFSMTEPLLWNIPWLLSAISWMPAGSYFLKNYPINLANSFRVLFVVLAAAWGICVVYFYVRDYDET